VNHLVNGGWEVEVFVESVSDLLSRGGGGAYCSGRIGGTAIGLERMVV
jgi:hypothetical protein